MATPQRRYTVLSLVETAAPQPDGRLAPLTLVSYQLASGHRFDARFDGHNLTPERVKELLEAEVAAKERIFALGS